MLLRLLTVSPQPPSAFWCSATQRRPLSIRASCDVLPRRSTMVNAVIAVAVESADDESSPTQYPSGVRPLRSVSRATRYAERSRSGSTIDVALSSSVGLFLDNLDPTHKR